MHKLVVRPAVRLDLIAIGDFIAADNPVRARSFIAEIQREFSKCAERPHSFPARDDLASGLRVARRRHYLIFFVADEATVEIVRVLHGRRDLSAAFDA